MSLQINYNAGVYEIQGNLNTENCVYLKSQLETVIKQSNGVVVSFDSLVSIDAYAAMVITSLQESTQSNNQIFYVIGKKNKKVEDQFNVLNYHHVLM